MEKYFELMYYEEVAGLVVGGIILGIVALSIAWVFYINCWYGRRK